MLPVAVNVPAEEADVRPVSSDAVKKALGDIDIQAFGDTIPASALARDDGTDLGAFLMGLLLALLAVECFMAMHFGHQRRTARLATAGAATPAAGFPVEPVPTAD